MVSYINRVLFSTFDCPWSPALPWQFKTWRLPCCGYYWHWHVSSHTRNAQSGKPSLIWRYVSNISVWAHTLTSSWQQIVPSLRSSLLRSTDRSALPRHDREPPLSDKIDPEEMRSHVQRFAPKDAEKKKAGDATVGKDALDKAASAWKCVNAGLGSSDILQSTQDIEGLCYHPRTAKTRDVYELMLSVVHQTLGDQASKIIRTATDTPSLSCLTRRNRMSMMGATKSAKSWTMKNMQRRVRAQKRLMKTRAMTKTIDVFRVQHQISEVLPDVTIAETKAKAALFSSWIGTQSSRLWKSAYGTLRISKLSPYYQVLEKQGCHCLVYEAHGQKRMIG